MATHSNVAAYWKDHLYLLRNNRNDPAVVSAGSQSGGIVLLSVGRIDYSNDVVEMKLTVQQAVAVAIDLLGMAAHFDDDMTGARARDALRVHLGDLAPQVFRKLKDGIDKLDTTSLPLPPSLPAPWQEPLQLRSIRSCSLSPATAG